MPGTKRASSKESDEESGTDLDGDALFLAEVSGAEFWRAGGGDGVSEMVGVVSRERADPHEGQKRDAPETSVPQVGQLMGVAGVYITWWPRSAIRQRGQRREPMHPRD